MLFPNRIRRNLRHTILGLSYAGLAFAQEPPERPVLERVIPSLQAELLGRTRIPFFYPPFAPAPGDEIDEREHLLDIAYDAPEGLRPYVGEIFYPILGARLAENHVPRRHHKRLSDYVAKRNASLEQLFASLADPIARPIDAKSASLLEKEAETIRSDLLTDHYQWGSFRTWKSDSTLRATNPPLAQQRELHVIRAGVFFLPGLSTEQRWLLWAYISQRPADDLYSTTGKDLVRPSGTIPFLPAGASLVLPQTIPPSLHQDLRAFSHRYRQMQVEIAEVVLAADRLESEESRASLKQFAERQAPALARLEAEAEHVRVELAKLPPSSEPSLPQDIAALSLELSTSRASLRRSLANTLRDIRRDTLSYKPGAEAVEVSGNFSDGVTFDGRRIPERLISITLNPSPEQLGRPQKAREALTAGLKAFAEENASREQEIAAKGRELITHTVAYIGTFEALDQVPNSEKALHAARLLAAHEQSRRLDSYSRYLVATTQPGLTPAQRRLLFGAALRDLNLPLPTGIRRPVRFSIDP